MTHETLTAERIEGQVCACQFGNCLGAEEGEDCKAQFSTIETWDPESAPAVDGIVRVEAERAEADALLSAAATAREQAERIQALERENARLRAFRDHIGLHIQEGDGFAYMPLDEWNNHAAVSDAFALLAAAPSPAEDEGVVGRVLAVALAALVDCADNLRLTRRELRILAQHVVPYSNTQAQHNNEAIVRADEAIATIRAALTGEQP